MIPAYLTPFRAQRFEREGEPSQYRLLSPFVYRTRVLASYGLDEALLLAPIGFEFDGSSVPRFGRWLECPGGRSIYGSCFHDFAYWFHAVLVIAPDGTVYWLDIDRETSDDISAEAWRVASPEVEIIPHPELVCWTLERTVRNFGWLVWSKETLPPRFDPPTRLGNIPDIPSTPEGTP